MIPGYYQPENCDGVKKDSREDCILALVIVKFLRIYEQRREENYHDRLKKILLVVALKFC